MKLILDVSRYVLSFQEEETQSEEPISEAIEVDEKWRKFKLSDFHLKKIRERQRLHQLIQIRVQRALTEHEKIIPSDIAKTIGDMVVNRVEERSWRNISSVSTIMFKLFESWTKCLPF